jgi:hypothetical protein
MGHPGVQRGLALGDAREMGLGQVGDPATQFGNGGALRHRRLLPERLHR